MDKIVVEENLSQTFPYLNNITIAGKTKEQHDQNVRQFLEASKKRNLTFNKTSVLYQQNASIFSDIKSQKV